MAIDRLRWYWNLSTADKLKYISKTFKDMDNALLYHKDLPVDWLNEPPDNYLKFLHDAQELLNKIANDLDKDKS